MYNRKNVVERIRRTLPRIRKIIYRRGRRTRDKYYDYKEEKYYNYKEDYYHKGKEGRQINVYGLLIISGGIFAFV